MEIASKLPLFYIRNIPIDYDLILAPMDDYTDSPYRQICQSFGSAICYSEFMSVDKLETKMLSGPNMWRKLRYSSSERPNAFQIYGSDINKIVSVAERLQDLGPSFIDINLSCPGEKITAAGAGAGMLKDPSKIASLFSRLTKKLKIPVTAKIRIGWDENNINYIEVSKALYDNGASLIAIHGRTRAQRHFGEANWAAIAEIKSIINIPIIGNGDVCNTRDIERIKKLTSCDGVMIGRAAQGFPWIFARKDVESITILDVVNVIKKHLLLQVGFYGEVVGLTRFEKHLDAYKKNFFYFNLPWEELRSSNSISHFLSMLERVGF